jgi:hypothetical protein
VSVTDSVAVERPFPERPDATPVLPRARVLGCFRAEPPLRLVDPPLGERLVERLPDPALVERGPDFPLVDRDFAVVDFEELEDALPREDLPWAMLPSLAGFLAQDPTHGASA